MIVVLFQLLLFDAWVYLRRVSKEIQLRESYSFYLILSKAREKASTY